MNINMVNFTPCCRENFVSELKKLHKHVKLCGSVSWHIEYVLLAIHLIELFLAFAAVKQVQ